MNGCMVVLKLKQIKRGNLYYANLNPVVGSEQGDSRPVLVVQNDIGNKYSPTIIVVPITRKLTKVNLKTHVVIPQRYGLDTDSLALVEQIRTLDRSRFIKYIGCIGATEQIEIDFALAICVDIVGKSPLKCELMELTLCGRCKNDFFNSGYIVVKKGWQEHKESCDFCKARQGFNYGIFNLP